MKKPFSAILFIEKSKQVHGSRYDYSRVVDHPTSSYLKVEIGCHAHGVFLQEAGYHLRGSGCPKCAQLKVNGSICKKFSAAEFIETAKKIHGDVYDYSSVKDCKRSTHLRVNIICRDHGPFEVSPKDHLGKRGGRCPRCSKRESYGEFLIRRCLLNLGIEFEAQKKFDNLRDAESNRRLSFDFYLPKYRALIEFDGEYHFHPPNFSKLNEQQLEILINKIRKRDKMKTDYALMNGFNLHRIHYSSRNPEDIANRICQIVDSRK